MTIQIKATVEFFNETRKPSACNPYLSYKTTPLWSATYFSCRFVEEILIWDIVPYKAVTQLNVLVRDQ